MAGYAPPPPARRERHVLRCAHPAPRTTSACAERTPLPAPVLTRPAHHLRLRGENPPAIAHGWNWPAPPPPARREPNGSTQPDRGRRTTSAFAERTAPPSGGPCSRAHR